MRPTKNTPADVVPPKGKAMFARLGPGLVAGAADDDPSGIATYSQAGARFGYTLQWTLVLTYPLMVAVQLIAAYTGRVTGVGLAENMRKTLPAWSVTILVALLFITNTINIGADLASMGAALQLVSGINPHVGTLAFAVFSGTLQIFVHYRRYSELLKWLTLVLFVYVAVLFTVNVDWGLLFNRLFWPRFELSRESTAMIVAIFGTTISPYMFFWQNAQEVESVQIDPKQKPLNEASAATGRRQLSRIRWDTGIGMAASNLIGIAIMVSSAATLHAHGGAAINSAADAAKALEPLAGRFSTILFALGIVGTGLLAVPVLAGSAAYAVGESRQWKCGLDCRPWDAKEFYGVIVAATLLGVGIDFAGINPIKALIASAIINGVIAVPILAVMMFIATRPALMGYYTLSRSLAAMGWLTTAVMAVASLAMFVL